MKIFNEDIKTFLIKFAYHSVLNLFLISVVHLCGMWAERQGLTFHYDLHTIGCILVHVLYVILKIGRLLCDKLLEVDEDELC